MKEYKRIFDDNNEPVSSKFEIKPENNISQYEPAFKENYREVYHGFSDKIMFRDICNPDDPDYPLRKSISSEVYLSEIDNKTSISSRKIEDYHPNFNANDFDYENDFFSSAKVVSAPQKDSKNDDELSFNEIYNYSTTDEAVNNILKSEELTSSDINFEPENDSSVSLNKTLNSVDSEPIVFVDINNVSEEEVNINSVNDNSFENVINTEKTSNVPFVKLKQKPRKLSLTNNTTKISDSDSFKTPETIIDNTNSVSNISAETIESSDTAVKKEKPIKKISSKSKKNPRKISDENNANKSFNNSIIINDDEPVVFFDIDHTSDSESEISDVIDSVPENVNVSASEDKEIVHSTEPVSLNNNPSADNLFIKTQNDSVITDNEPINFKDINNLFIENSDNPFNASASDSMNNIDNSVHEDIKVLKKEKKKTLIKSKKESADIHKDFANDNTNSDKCNKENKEILKPDSVSPSVIPQQGVINDNLADSASDAMNSYDDEIVFIDICNDDCQPEPEVVTAINQEKSSAKEKNTKSKKHIVSDIFAVHVNPDNDSNEASENNILTVNNNKNQEVSEVISDANQNNKVTSPIEELFDIDNSNLVIEPHMKNENKKSTNFLSNFKIRKKAQSNKDEYNPEIIIQNQYSDDDFEEK